MAEPRAPEECANCGATIPRGAKSCPECGADERTGWRENEATRYDGLDLPADAFDDEEAVRPAKSIRRARTQRDARGVNGVAWYWWCVGVALALLLALGALRLR
jgi:hypothetical protein